MGFDAEDKERYQIPPEDAPIIKAFQVCKAFNCLDFNLYRNNPAWWNDACYALIHTENKAQSDKIEEHNG